MGLFRRTAPPAPAGPTNDQLLTTLAAAMMMAEVTHDGTLSLTPEDQIVLINAQAEAMRRGLL